MGEGENRKKGGIGRMEGKFNGNYLRLTGKPIGKRSLGRPRRRWEEYIRMNLKEMGISTRNCVGSARDKGC